MPTTGNTNTDTTKTNSVRSGKILPSSPPDEEIDILKQLLVINEENLVKEWAEQPIRYVQAVRVCARAEAALSNLRVECDVFEALLDRELRAQGLEGVARVTDTAIKAAICADERTVVRQQKIIDAEHRVAILRGILRAYEQRERSLKYIQMSRALPLDSESRELGRAARATALRRYVEES